MELNELISENAIFLDVKANSKRQLIQALSKKTSSILAVEEQLVFDTIMQREKLGSTAVGSGVAIPHGKIESLEKITGLFVKLNKPIAFEAVDEKPVDIIFLLLAPTSAGAEHLKALSKIARLFRDENYLQKIRECEETQTIYNLLTQEENKKEN